MAEQQGASVVGVFDRREDAECAMDALRRMGLKDKQLGMAMRNEEGLEPGDKGGSGNQAKEGAAKGAATGGVLGGLLGAAASLLIPGIGPVLATGILGSALTGATVGAFSGGMLGALTGLGLPEEEARFYDQEFQAGRILVTAHVESRFKEVWDAMHQCGGYNMRTKGQKMNDQTLQAEPDGVKRIPIQEEQLEIRKEPVQIGQVEIRKEVITETRTIEVPVTREEIVIVRRPVQGQGRDETNIGEGETIRIPIMEEQVIVEKRPVVTGEVTVHKEQVQMTKHVRGDVRREEVEVEQTGNAEVKTDGGEQQP